MRTGDGDVVVLERLTEGFEDGPRELRELVEKEDPVVRERDLARTRDDPASDDRGGGRGAEGLGGARL